RPRCALAAPESSRSMLCGSSRCLPACRLMVTQTSVRLRHHRSTPDYPERPGRPAPPEFRRSVFGIGGRAAPGGARAARIPNRRASALGGRDVLVDAEEVARIVRRLHGGQLGVVLAVGGAHAIRTAAPRAVTQRADRASDGSILRQWNP